MAQLIFCTIVLLAACGANASCNYESLGAFGTGVGALEADSIVGSGAARVSSEYPAGLYGQDYLAASYPSSSVAVEESSFGYPSSSVPVGLPSIGCPVSSVAVEESSFGYPSSSVPVGLPSIGCPVSSVAFGASRVGYPVSSVAVEQSSIGYPSSSVPVGVSSIGYPASAVAVGSSNFGYPESSIAVGGSSIGYSGSPVAVGASSFGYPEASVADVGAFLPPGALIPVGPSSCGPDPSIEPVRSLRPVVLKPVNSPIQRLPAPNAPRPVIISNKCFCTKKVVKPQLYQRLIQVQKNQRFLKKTYRPVVEKVAYRARPRC